MNPNSTYLEDLIALNGFHNIRELEEVFQDVEDWINGNPSIYSLDTFDLVSYCFPFSLDQNSTKLSHEAAASNYLSYYYLFHKYDFNPIILDEYEIELYSIFKKLSNYTHQNKNVRTIKERLVKEFDESIKKGELEDFFNKNLGVIISIIYGLLDVDSLTTFKDIVNNKLQIHEFKLKNNPDNKSEWSDQNRLFNILRTTKSDNETAAKIYESFTKENAYYIASMKPEKKNNYLSSTFIDIQVLVRLYDINQKIDAAYNQGLLSTKYKFLYLSSTPFKSDEIQKYYSKVKNVGRSKNLLRKNYQFYLMALLKDMLDDDQQQDSVILKDIVRSKLTNCMDKFDQIKLYLEERPNEFSELKKGISVDRTQLENSMLNVKIYKDIEDITSKLEKRQTDALQGVFNKLIQRIENSKYNSLIDDLNSNLEVYSSSYNVYSHIYSPSKGKMETSIPIGADVVKSHMQSIPILLFQSLKIPQNVKDNFAREIIKLINTDYKVRSFNFDYHGLKKCFSLSSIENKLLLHFLTFLNIDVSSIKEENDILTEIDKLIIENRYRIYRYIHETNQKVSVAISSNKEVHLELIYFATWLKRRSNKESEFRSALKMIQEFKSNYKITAPRLTHSKALIYVSWASLENDEDRKIGYFSKSLSLCKKAIQEYSSPESKSQFHGDSLEYIYLGLKNTIIYCWCQIAFYTRLYSNIFDRSNTDSFAPRSLLNELKTSKKIESDTFFSLNLTEIDLEFCEYSYYHGIGQSGKAREILRHAKKRLKTLKKDMEEMEDKNKHQDSIRRIEKLMIH
ncbi:MAG: hypothetical protein K0U54_11870 [Bacteroidetes bacterium]|nr:hypothetical protein [Bacteroidota bacterium]